MRLPRLSTLALLAGVLGLASCQQAPRILFTPIQPLREAELECSGSYERTGFDELSDTAAAVMKW